MHGLQKLSTENAASAWNQLVAESVNIPTLAHNPCFYNFFSGYLSLSPYYFILTTSDQAVGLFPIVRAGKKFISMPHLSYGGIFWLKEPGPQHKEDLIISEIACIIHEKSLAPGFYQFSVPDVIHDEKQKLPEIEIRNEQSFFGNRIFLKTRHFMYLQENEEEQWEKFSSNLKRKIQKAEKNGLEIKVGRHELLTDFWSVYRNNMRHLGSPVLGINFFKALLDQPGLKAEIFISFYEMKPVGAAFNMNYNGFYENVWFSTLRKYNHLYTSYLLHWSIIKQAVSAKEKIYSMGRSTSGSGVHRYKSQWPVEEKPLFFSINYPEKIQIKNQKWLTKIWKIMPSVLTDRLGPVIAKRIY